MTWHWCMLALWRKSLVWIWGHGDKSFLLEFPLIFHLLGKPRPWINTVELECKAFPFGCGRVKDMGVGKVGRRKPSCRIPKIGWTTLPWMTLFFLLARIFAFSLFCSSGNILGLLEACLYKENEPGQCPWFKSGKWTTNHHASVEVPICHPSVFQRKRVSRGTWFVFSFFKDQKLHTAKVGSIDWLLQGMVASWQWIHGTRILILTVIVDLIWLNDNVLVVYEAHRMLQFLLAEYPNPLIFEACFKSGERSGFEELEEGHQDDVREQERHSIRLRRHAHQAKGARRNELIEGDFWGLIEHMTDSLERSPVAPLQASIRLMTMLLHSWPHGCLW